MLVHIRVMDATKSANNTETMQFLPHFAEAGPGFLDAGWQR
jgi:hypothetical protein